MKDPLNPEKWKTINRFAAFFTPAIVAIYFVIETAYIIKIASGFDIDMKLSLLVSIIGLSVLLTFLWLWRLSTVMIQQYVERGDIKDPFKAQEEDFYD